MPDIRTPQQSRSIEKKKKILKAGFELFCEKGYYATNTNDICRRAGVSTGALYSYFTDKKDIFIASFEAFIEGYVKPLLESLNELEEPFNLDLFIDKCTDIFISLYQSYYKAMNELANMQLEDEEISQKFCGFEDTFMNEFIKILASHNIRVENLAEKFYLVFILIDALAQEKTFNRHETVDFDILKNETYSIIKGYLLTHENK